MAAKKLILILSTLVFFLMFLPSINAQEASLIEEIGDVEENNGNVYDFPESNDEVYCDSLDCIGTSIPINSPSAEQGGSQPVPSKDADSITTAVVENQGHDIPNTLSDDLEAILPVSLLDPEPAAATFVRGSEEYSSGFIDAELLTSPEDIVPSEAVVESEEYAGLDDPAETQDIGSGMGVAQTDASEESKESMFDTVTNTFVAIFGGIFGMFGGGP